MTVCTTHDISYFSNATLQNSECPCHTRHSLSSLGVNRMCFPLAWAFPCHMLPDKNLHLQASRARLSCPSSFPTPLVLSPRSFLPPSVRQGKMLDVPFTQLPLCRPGRCSETFSTSSAPAALSLRSLRFKAKNVSFRWVDALVVPERNTTQFIIVLFDSNGFQSIGMADRIEEVVKQSNVRAHPREYLVKKGRKVE